MISMKSMSRTSRRKSSNRGENRLTDFRRLGSETSFSIRRPSASTSIVRLQPTSFLQGVTPLKGIFSGESSSERQSQAASLPPSYATRDPIEHGSATTGNTLQHSFTYDYIEHPRQEKTMTGNETDPEQQNEIDVNQMTARAEAAARTAEAALKASQRERQAAEIMQRTAKETAERFAEKASKDARPQLDMMERHHEQLQSAVQGMNILSSQNALMITKITPFTGNPRDFKRFMANFENNVSRKCADDLIRLKV